jgi:hypothetical protein
MTKTMLLAFAGLIAVSSAASAAMPPGVTLSADKKIVYIDRIFHPFHAPSPPAGKKIIFSNLATLDPLGVYMVGTGLAFGGPDGVIGQDTIAVAFTPTVTAAITEVQAALGYIEGKKSAALINIYADSAGSPGTLLWSQRVKMPASGDCCASATAKNVTGLTLTAGTQYWIGAAALPGAPDTFAAWSFNVADQVTTAQFASDLGNGWILSPTLPNLAFAIYGN